MKKTLVALTAVITVMLTSCSNDDLPVYHTTTFKVDPSTVISSYVEYNVGDLTSLYGDYKLRIRLLAYNEEGILVASDEAFSDDYTHIQTFSFDLVDGTYTTVAITDVILPGTDGIEFYTLANQQRLSTTQVSDAGYIGGAMGILGLSTERRTISSSTGDVTIQVKPAGALIVCEIEDWNACTNFVNSDGDPIDASSFTLAANQLSSDLSLNSNGDPIFSVNSSSEYAYRWFAMDRNPQYTRGYGYIFKFPMKNVKLKWQVRDADKTYAWGEPILLDIEIGKEYYFSLDVASDEAGWYDLDIEAQRSRAEQHMKRTGNVLRLDFNPAIENESLSVKPVDYLKRLK